MSIIKASLIDTVDMSDDMSDGKLDKEALRRMQIEKFLENHENIMNADVRMLCDVSAATANRILASLVAEGKLMKYRNGSRWAYQLVRD